MELVHRPSYATRYRATRDRHPGDTSPQRRTATIVRRVPESAVVEGNLKHDASSYPTDRLSLSSKSSSSSLFLVRR